MSETLNISTPDGDFPAYVARPAVGKHYDAVAAEKANARTLAFFQATLR